MGIWTRAVFIIGLVRGGTFEASASKNDLQLTVHLAIVSVRLTLSKHMTNYYAIIADGLA